MSMVRLKTIYKVQKRLRGIEVSYLYIFLFIFDQLITFSVYEDHTKQLVGHSINKPQKRTTWTHVCFNRYKYFKIMCQ